MKTTIEILREVTGRELTYPEFVTGSELISINEAMLAMEMHTLNLQAEVDRLKRILQNIPTMS